VPLHISTGNETWSIRIYLLFSGWRFGGKGQTIKEVKKKKKDYEEEEKEKEKKQNEE
jgi:hypothetical protein